jgi:hypothetical protein
VLFERRRSLGAAQALLGWDIELVERGSLSGNQIIA